MNVVLKNIYGCGFTEFDAKTSIRALDAHQRRSGRGDPKKGQSRKVRLFTMTLISWFLGPSILGSMSAKRERERG